MKLNFPHPIKRFVGSCSFSLFLTKGGRVFISGQFNKEKGSNVFVPFFPIILKDEFIFDIFSGMNHVFLLAKSGSIFAVFNKDYLPCFVQKNTFEKQDTLIEFSTLPDFVTSQAILKISCGFVSTVFLTKSGDVYVHGENIFLKDETNKEYLRTPVLVKKFKAMKLRMVDGSVDVSNEKREHALFLSSEGRVFSCGLNRNGQLGLSAGNFSQRNIFSDIEIRKYISEIDYFQDLRGSKRVTSVLAAGFSSYFFTNDGRFFCCGSNLFSQMVPTFNTRKRNRTDPQLLGDYHIHNYFDGEKHLKSWREPLDITEILRKQGYDMVEMVMSMDRSLWMDSKGRVFSIGCGENGCLGVGNEINYVDLFRNVKVVNNWVKMFKQRQGKEEFESIFQKYI